MISINDSRFDQTYLEWAGKFLLCLGCNPILIDSDVPSVNDGVTISMMMMNNTVQPIESKIKTDIYRELKYLKNSHLNEVLLGYDSHTYTLNQMALVLDQIVTKRRRKDYLLRIKSAFSLSAKLENIANYYFDFSIIDEPIPDINILQITYLGQRNLSNYEPSRIY